MTCRTRAAVIATAALAIVTAACSSSDGASRSSVVTVAAPTTTVPAAATNAPATTAPVTSTSPSSTAAPASPTTAPATTAPTTTPTATAAPPPAPTAPATPDLGAVGVTLTRIVTLTEPVKVTARAGDPAVHVAERRGRVVRVVGGDVASVVLDMQGLTRAGGERGLLGIAYSPDGARLYASYTDTSGTSVIDEYTLGADGAADHDTRRQVLTQRQPFANHNGGDIVFGPDGMLYFGLGDGGSANDPQRNSLKLSTWLGKLLRIDPRAADGAPYAVPADNPFLDTDGARPEIWSIGLRNPWRFSFDAATGDLWIADVGQNRWEEVDVSRAADGAGRGVNFGWSSYEGDHRFNTDQPGDDHTPPIHEYEHGSGGCSISGGAVYRGAAIPALRGAYVFADYCAAGVRAIDPADAARSVSLSPRPGTVVSVDQGPGNELYVSSFDGGVYRLDAA
jgi:glucose/arabinose dehydrogenase